MTSPNPVRIRLRYPDLDAFVEKFAPNVTRGGVFLASRTVHPVGSVVPFEIQLVSGAVVLAGQGKVSWVKEYDPATPNRPYGLGVQFVGITAATKPILARLLRAKEVGPEKARAAATGAPSGAAAAAGPVGASPLANGKPAAPRVDTSVDLVAEFGLEESAVRRAINRTWMSGSRTTDDLADLARPEPPETATLAQALAELPRLLDPQFSRRRSSAGFRPLEAGGPSPAASAGGSGPASGATAASTSGVVLARAGGAGSGPVAASDDEAGDAAESTDMGGPAGDEAADGGGESLQASAGAAEHGRRGRRRRR